MSPPKSSILRNVMQLPPETIAAMGENDLNELMTALLRAQAYKSRSALNEVLVNAEGKAGDEGCDGWSPDPEIEDDWLGAAKTCWQFKVGKAGEPSKLKGEVVMPLPKTTLEDGGRFVVVATGSNSGIKGVNARRKVLVDEAKAAGIPHANIVVLGSELLANWCNEHPAIAARWGGRPEGLWTFVEWAAMAVHQTPWQATDIVTAALTTQRADIDFVNESVLHLHIHGQPGVGKTRYALELCRAAEWVQFVIYFPQATDGRLLELIDSTAVADVVRLIIVADEIQPEQLEPLRNAIDRGNGRIRLITVGHCRSLDPARIPAILVSPLHDDMALKVIRGWHPSMPIEHIDFVVRFAAGYIRLAKLAADAVARDPAMNVHRLLSRDEICYFLDKMLVSESRRALYVVAVLSRVGWTEDKQIEGETVARHLGLDWNDVRDKVGEFHRKFGIAPSGGRYRYISPTPLGTYLAVEAWEKYPDLLRSLPSVLPTEDAKDAYFERLKSMASAPQAREYAREELTFFFRLDDFVDARAVRRWASLLAADPDLAVRNLLSALSGASIEEREKLGAARREIIWTLVRLAWSPTSFADATMALALLAEAENETWSNNATGEFLARFQVVLGGTAVPYVDRLAVLDDLVDEDRPALTRLVIKALAKVGNRFFHRIRTAPASDDLPEKEWRPQTETDKLDCIQSAISRLVAITRRGAPELQDDLVNATTELASLLADRAVRPLVVDLFHALRGVYPESRESLRRAIAKIVHHERKYRKELPVEELAELNALHTHFEGASLTARLRQQVGAPQGGRDEQPDLAPLAKELFASQNALEEEWPWLTSGGANEAWRLGEALAQEDSNKILATILPSLSDAGHDQRVLCGYISACRQKLGDEWYDQWFDSQFEQEQKPISLLCELVWRCGVTSRIVSHVTEMLKIERISPELVGQWAYSHWIYELPLDNLDKILWAMTASGHEAVAANILDHRLKKFASEREKWKPLALKLIMLPELIRSSSTTSYHWGQIALSLVTEHPGAIASAIFSEQADHSKSIWFVEHNDAAQVLQACVESDPRAVWEAILPCLTSYINADSFSIGFPRGLVDQMPLEDVLAWVAENPNEHGAMLAGLVNDELLTDETLAARVLGAYGHLKTVASAFTSACFSGSWSGSESAHWDRLAKKMDDVAKRTKLPKLRRWASGTANVLFRMSKRERQREEEEDLR